MVSTQAVSPIITNDPTIFLPSLQQLPQTLTCPHASFALPCRQERISPFMASPAQVKANKANSKLSTGPRTAEGKARSSRNGTSHGLSAADVIVFPGEEQAFADLHTSLIQDL